MTNEADSRTTRARALRKQGGISLKSLREQALLTQGDLAKHLGYAYTTQISQIERGLGRIPPEDLAQWAAALKVEPAMLAKQMLLYFDPQTHASLYGEPNPLLSDSVGFDTKH